MSDPLIHYLPHDADAARPEDLRRRQSPPPTPTVLSAEAATVAWPGEDPTVGNFHYIGAALTPQEFKEYCLQYNFGSAPPSYWIWHHTYNPDASWAPVSTNQATWWDRNEAGMSVADKKAKRKPQLDAIMRYYRDTKKWTVGPHLFIDDLFIWLFTPMYYVGIHANEGNSYARSGKTRYSIGCEVIGAYDTVSWPKAIYDRAGWACACVKARLNFGNIYTAAGQDRPDLHDPQLSGHRDYTTEKSCPGRAISNSFFVQSAVDGWSAYQANRPPGPIPPLDPLTTHRLPGPMRPMLCSKRVYDFYNASGTGTEVAVDHGFSFFGFALRDQFRTTVGGVPCSVMVTERAVIKDSEAFGLELALLSEARQEGWLP